MAPAVPHRSPLLRLNSKRKKTAAHTENYEWPKHSGLDDLFATIIMLFRFNPIPGTGERRSLVRLWHGGPRNYVSKSRGVGGLVALG